jgi:hypothetical protein
VAEEQLPPDIGQFIDQHIQSVEQLETLLLLHAQSQRAFKPEDVSKELYTTTDSAAKRLVDLKMRGFCMNGSEGAYRYAPLTADLARMIAELTRLYRERRVSVISRIYSKPPQPPQDIQAFSDAFRLKNEKKKED